MATPKEPDPKYKTEVEEYLNLCGINVKEQDDLRKNFDANQPNKNIGIHVLVIGTDNTNNLIKALESDGLKYRKTAKEGWYEIQPPAEKLFAVVDKKRKEMLSSALDYINSHNKDPDKAAPTYGVGVNAGGYPLLDEINKHKDRNLVQAFSKGGTPSIDMKHLTIKDSKTVTIHLPLSYNVRPLDIDVEMSKMIKLAELQKNEKKQSADRGAARPLG